MSRGEFELQSTGSREELAQAIQKAANTLGRPLSEAVPAMTALPVSTLEVLIGRRVRSEILSFPKKIIDPTDSNPFPPAA